MVPVFELRGALPFGVGLGLDPWVALVVSILGNMVPVPFIILFIRRILEWMKRFEKFRRIAEKLEEKAKKHEDKIEKYEALGLFFLVAIPLPGTGAWTGSLVAAIFDLRMKTAVPVIFAGVVTAGIVVFLITYGVVAIV
ncbi:MAG: small multi-drug export protein [Firmicutes bacterium]|nr:small multi-drug export protein [Bacillota bacterium]